MEAPIANRLQPGAGLAERIARQLGVAFVPRADTTDRSGPAPSGSGKGKGRCG